MRYKTKEELFWSHVDKHGPYPSKNSFKVHPEIKNTRCWMWKAATTTKGYGSFGFEGRQQQAHRVAWQLLNGKIQDEIKILHKCDNEGCVRHLFSGTLQDNANDMKLKGRQAKEERHGRSKFTNKEVKEMRKLYASGGFSFVVLAKMNNVSPPTIENIIKRVSYQMLFSLDWVTTFYFHL